MSEKSFLSDMLQRIARAGPFLSSKLPLTPENLIELCEELVSDKGEASGLKTAFKIMDIYDTATMEERRSFFLDMAEKFGVNHNGLEKAVANWQPGDNTAARELYFAAQPRSQELIRRLNRVPGGAARLVRMRADLLSFVKEEPSLKALDHDFQHLFSFWFTRGFLEISQIDWSTPASILEKIIAYEAVHQIHGWDDLRQRVAEVDRRMFAFFHPAMPGDPLIFVEVALTKKIPGSITEILEQDREPIDANAATSAIFYSISNCQNGLRGISFGNFLIKQVVAELQRAIPSLNTFVTLSPVPGLRRWVNQALEGDEPLLSAEDRSKLEALGEDDVPSPEFAARLAARYLLNARSKRGTAFDPVANFHLGNGAILHKVHANADLSANGKKNSWGVMVNYLYNEAKIEEHHQAYATDTTIACSSEVRSLAK
ncbi:malonyl-CoA decarboxylase [Cohaesibacter sp. ES.047]|uniref:malonyl-CoA decarboxylase n=1 Tax=Cohaesibacter sp. ES.047 TaxID=1798205 RepID=UPI000BB72E34|nr:malonyl-CoA decarboxylase [Cohaesibacter sp. ES.047]SNY90099.1 malonyl-CoA decarboxylase [Cohaesibacter sp. ES.047]